LNSVIDVIKFWKLSQIEKNQYHIVTLIVNFIL
jgi:hypothetical protein